MLKKICLLNKYKSFKTINFLSFLFSKFKDSNPQNNLVDKIDSLDYARTYRTSERITSQLKKPHITVCTAKIKFTYIVKSKFK